MSMNRRAAWAGAILGWMPLALWPSWAAEPAAPAPPALVGTAKWEAEILAFEASDKTNAPPERPIVFIGSSSIRLWTSLAEDFPGQPVINRGFGGSQIADSIYFADRIATPYRPRMVVMYAGGNDIHAGKTPAQVLGDFRAFVAKMRSAVPDCSLAYISIAGNPARWAEVAQVREANALIRAHCEADGRLVFIDVHSAMLGEDGLPKPDIFRKDRLHMNDQGYALWRQLIGARLFANPSR